METKRAAMPMASAEHRRPFAEGEVGGDDDRGALVEPAHQVEQQLAAGLGEGQVAELVEQDEVAPGVLLGGATLTAGPEFGLEEIDQLDDVVAAAAGARKAKETARREQFERWIEQDLARQFEGRVLPFDGAAATVWGRLMGDGDRTGRPPAAADAQIAAVAIQHELTLVTRNEKDFVHFDMPLLNPWRLNEPNE